jgi:hypothetical protein
MRLRWGDSPDGAESAPPDDNEIASDHDEIDEEGLVY